MEMRGFSRENAPNTEQAELNTRVLKALRGSMERAQAEGRRLLMALVPTIALGGPTFAGSHVERPTLGDPLRMEVGVETQKRVELPARTLGDVGIEYVFPMNQQNTTGVYAGLKFRPILSEGDLSGAVDATAGVEHVGQTTDATTYKLRLDTGLRYDLGDHTLQTIYGLEVRIDLENLVVGDFSIKDVPFATFTGPKNLVSNSPEQMGHEGELEARLGAKLMDGYKENELVVGAVVEKPKGTDYVQGNTDWAYGVGVDFTGEDGHKLRLDTTLGIGKGDGEKAHINGLFVSAKVEW